MSNDSISAGDLARARGRAETGRVISVANGYATIEYAHEGRSTLGYYPVEACERVEKPEQVQRSTFNVQRSTLKEGVEGSRAGSETGAPQSVNRKS